MNLSIYRYKPDQGRLSRGVAFWLVSAVIYYGCRTLYFFLHWPWAKSNLIEEHIPIADVPLNMALILSFVVFLAAEWGLVWMINRRKMGELLIETETEMKKVSWPSWNDSFSSSIVVLIAVIFFMIFLGFSDALLHRVFSNIIFGRLH